MSGGFPRERPEFVTLELDRRVREACARAARGVLDAGLSVIVELGLFDPWGRARIAAILSAYPTFVVRVSCDLAVLEEREEARGDRVAGTARRQYEQLKAICFDYDVVTHEQSPEVLAHDLARWLASGPAPSAVYELRGAR